MKVRVGVLQLLITFTRHGEMQVVLTEEEILVHANAEERKFLEQILLAKCYDLLETRLDYLQRVFVRDKEFAHELYFQLLLAGEMREIIQFVRSKCTPSNYLVLDLAVEKKVKFCKLNTYFSGIDIHRYYVTILKTDSLDLFLEVEEELKKVLHEELIRTYIIESKAMKIIHYLCTHGMLDAITDDCLIMLKGVFSQRDTSRILTEIASRYDCVDFFTRAFMRYALLRHYFDKCELLLQLGAKPNSQQREELAHSAPDVYWKFFGEDV